MVGLFASSYYTDVGTSDERFDTLISMVREKLSQYPQFANIPVEIHEFGILSENGKWIVGEGTEWGGSWMAHFANSFYWGKSAEEYSKDEGIFVSALKKSWLIRYREIRLKQ